jgi:hypothetical protein
MTTKGIVYYTFDRSYATRPGGCWWATTLKDWESASKIIPLLDLYGIDYEATEVNWVNGCVVPPKHVELLSSGSKGE